jgi:hypothetical protein
MTDTQLNQLRQNLMAQFKEMVTEELPPGGSDYPDGFHNLGWDDTL